MIGGLVDKDDTINSLPSDEDNFKEETTTLPPHIYQQGQQFSARGYVEKLLSLFNKLLLCFDLGNDTYQKYDTIWVQNQTHDVPISFNMDCGEEYMDYDGPCAASGDTENLRLFSKLSYERKGFDGRDNDSQEKVQPLPTHVLKT